MDVTDVRLDVTGDHDVTYVVVSFKVRYDPEHAGHHVTERVELFAWSKGQERLRVTEWVTDPYLLPEQKDKGDPLARTLPSVVLERSPGATVVNGLHVCDWEASKVSARVQVEPVGPTAGHAASRSKRLDP